MSILAKDSNGYAIQGFAPNRIVEVANDASLTLTGVMAVRVSSPVSYQINGSGSVGSMSGVTVVSGVQGVTSFKNKNGATVAFEVMD
jgi:hypothetical protein